MFKALCVLFIVAQIVAAKKKQTSLEKATEKVSAFLKDVKDFFEDIMGAITDILGFGDKPPKKKVHNTKNSNNNWGTDIFKYMRKTVKSGYKTLKNAIPVLDMARTTIDDIGPMLPNITTAQFIERLLQQMMPDLMKNNPKPAKNEDNLIV